MLSSILLLITPQQFPATFYDKTALSVVQAETPCHHWYERCSEFVCMTTCIGYVAIYRCWLLRCCSNCNSCSNILCVQTSLLSKAYIYIYAVSNEHRCTSHASGWMLSSHHSLSLLLKASHLSGPIAVCATQLPWLISSQFFSIFWIWSV